jgi:hypothetical protein
MSAQLLQVSSLVSGLYRGKSSSSSSSLHRGCLHIEPYKLGSHNGFVVANLRGAEVPDLLGRLVSGGPGPVAFLFR